MSIASEITRLQGVKSDILQAISDKGVTVPAGSALDDCPGLIADIPTGAEPFPDGSKPVVAICNTDPTHYLPITNISVKLYGKYEMDILTGEQGSLFCTYSNTDSKWRLQIRANTYIDIQPNYGGYGGGDIVGLPNGLKGTYRLKLVSGESTKAGSYIVNDTVYAQGGDVSISYANFECDELRIFSNNGDTSNGCRLCFGFRYYDENDTLVYDLKPAEKNGVVGMYDTISGVFHASPYNDGSIYAVYGVSTERLLPDIYEPVYALYQVDGVSNASYGKLLNPTQLYDNDYILEYTGALDSSIIIDSNGNYGGLFGRTGNSTDPNYGAWIDIPSVTATTRKTRISLTQGQNISVSLEIPDISVLLHSSKSLYIKYDSNSYLVKLDDTTIASGTFSDWTQKTATYTSFSLGRGAGQYGQMSCQVGLAHISAKNKSTGKYIFDVYPAIRKVDNYKGFYDKVSGLFLTPTAQSNLGIIPYPS